MKRGFYILLVLVVVIAGISCNKTKSYTDLLKDQQRAIDNLIDEKGFTLLSEYPKDGVFKEGEFIQIGGVYVNVIDSGRGDMAEADTRVLCRMKGYYLINDTSCYNYDAGQCSPFDLFPIGNDPLEFTFGRSYSDQYYMSEGVLIPLTFLRDSAIVSLIIPFQVGSYFSQNYSDPLYLERVRYIFYK